MPVPKKILHIVAGSRHGGAETFCLDTIKALHEVGVQQHVICRPHENYLDALRARGIPHDTLGFTLWDRLWRGPALLRRRVSEYRPDIVHAWMGRAASIVPAGLSVPVLGWFGGYYDLKRYKNCSYYMGVTHDIVRHIIKSGAPEDRVFLVHTFGTLEQAQPVARATLATPDEAPVVLLLSRMHQKKGVDTLLEAARTLNGVYFWLAGDGPELDLYKDMATKLGVADRVRFLGWRDDRSALLKAANICALPSRYEPFGTVMAEAWFAGVPLVAARAAGPSQYVKNEQNGLLSDINDAAALAQNIQSILTDTDLRHRLIAGGHATYQSLFTKDIVVAEMRAAYTRMNAPRT